MEHLSAGATDSGDDEIVFDLGYFRLYKDGRVHRAKSADATAPAGFDAATGVTSRDVVIDGATGGVVEARLYMPAAIQLSNANAATKAKLPILVFFHGGAFVFGSPRHPKSHRYANRLVAAARVVAVSVRYRLAPEHPLPAAYDDAWAALRWAVSGRADPWLYEHGDLGRVFVAGGSAGANIAHNMAMTAAGVEEGEPRYCSIIQGVILLHPSFSGKQRMEEVEEEEEFWRSNNKRWTAIFPGAKDGLDDPRINPMAPGAPSLARLAGKRLLVCTASEDARAPRGRAYRDAVRASGWRGEVEWFESRGEGHCFFLHDPSGSEAAKLMDRVVAFVAGR